MNYRLFADEACWKFRQEQPRAWNSFGCGPGRWGDYLIPDTMWGLYIGEACKIHDWGYRLSPGASEEHRFEQDRILKWNCMRIINAAYDYRMEHNYKWHRIWEWLHEKRTRRAELYYETVRSRGGPAYWEDRNPKSKYKLITQGGLT